MKHLKNTIMKANLYKITLVLLVFILGNTAFAQNNLLYVGVTDDPVDNSLTEYLGQVGYAVTFVSQDDFKVAPYDDAAAYEAYDAIYISEVVGSGSVVNFKTAGFPIPCVSSEGYCVRAERWDFLTDNDAQFLQLSSADVTEEVKTLVINDVDHWIASNYDTPYDLIWTNAEIDNLGVTGCKLDENVDGAVELGSFLVEAMAEFPSFWAIPEGSTLISDGSVELPNIVVIGVIGPGLGEFATSEYNELIVNSLKWVTGDYEVPESIINVQEYDLNVWPNPTNGIVNISFTLPVSGSVQINVYDITGSLVKTTSSDFLMAGSNIINLDFSRMAAAQYIYEVITEKDILRGKICKN
jgi:hypothetical protein